MTEPVTVILPGICGQGLSFCLDGFRLLLCVIALMMWVISGVFSLEYMAHYQNKIRYYLSFWLTFFAVAGVFLSNNFYTTFLFFEIMSFTSYVWVAFDEKKESLKAAETYLAVAVIGGLTMLMGLFMLYHLCGTLEFQPLFLQSGKILAEGGSRAGEVYIAGILLLVGFGAKAGCFPLHIWLPKAHPVAPAPASALLSGILTKTGIFGLIAVSMGMFANEKNWGLLIAVLGLVTMFWGALLAVFSIDLKRTLACSSVSQIGFILTGIGMAVLLSAAGESPVLAVRGTILHMVNHSLMKLVLFLSAGAVFMNLHQLDLNQIRGFGRKKPVLACCFFAGAAGLAGVPGFSGYISKTLLHESIVEYGAYAGTIWWTGAEWLFLITGGMTAAYMLKLFIALFLETNPDRQKEFDEKSQSCMRPLSKGVLVIPALFILLFGLLPGFTMDRIASLGQKFFVPDMEVHPVSYFSVTNLKGALISLTFGMVFYLGICKCLMEKGQYKDRLPQWFDLEHLVYRPVLQAGLPGVFGAVCSFIDKYVISVPLITGLTISSIICRGMDHLADSVILFARKTTHSQIPKASGSKKKVVIAEEKESITSRMFRLESQLSHVFGLIEESFSFGLMLFCIGLFLTIGYLLLAFFEVV